MPRPRLLIVATLLLLTFAAHGSEVAVSAPQFVVATNADARSMGSVASGGGTDLVAWTEQPNRMFQQTWQVFIRTYDASGAPRQPAQIAIGFGFDPIAVWNGTDFFVAYGRYFSRFGTLLPSPDVEAVRVTADGRVIEGSRVALIQTRESGGSIYALAWDGAHYLAAVRTDQQQKVLVLDREGHVVGDAGSGLLSIAALPGGGFVVLRNVADRFEVQRLASDGTRGALMSLFLLGQGEAKIEAHGDRMAVVLHTRTGTLAEELDGDARVVVSVALPPDALIRSLVWRESSWVAAYERSSEGCTVRFGSGVVTETECSATARQPFAGADRAAWIEKSVEVRTSRGLSLSGGDVASISAAAQSEPAASGSLVAWIEQGRLHVCGSRCVDRVIETEAIPHHPALATAAGETLLVYVDGDILANGAIRALRLDADGQPLAPPLTLGEGAEPAVASDGHDWLVAWRTSDANFAKPQVLAARVTANGDATAATPVFANAAAQYHPSLAWSGAGYLVAWIEGEQAPSGMHTRVMTQLVDRDGARTAGEVTLDDQLGFSFVDVTAGCGPSACLVTWTHDELFDAVLGSDGTRRSENQLLTHLAPSTVAIEQRSDGTFRVAHANRFLFADANGAALADITWSSTYATIAGLVDGRIIYARATSPEEMLGGAMRLFSIEEPSLTRVRAARR